MQNKAFRKIVQTRKYTYWFTEYEKLAEDQKEGKEEEKEEKESKSTTRRVKGVWENTNKMLGSGWSGIKTGVTPNAGPCLAASLYKCFSGKEYEFLAVLLDCGGM